MKFIGVNLWAVLASALATMVVGFVWYSPLLFARPWMVLMGYDPNDKAKIAEMQKSAGPSYGLSLVASLVSAAVLGKIIVRRDDSFAAVWHESGAGRVAGIRDHGATDECPLQPAAGQTVRHQYGLSVGVLPGYGSDPWGVAVGGSLYSKIMPPVSSARRVTWRSWHQRCSSFTIFSVAHGSQ